MKYIFPLLFIALLIGCAAQYDYYEEEVVDSGPQWTEAQIDSIIRFNRMFFFDYYRQMDRTNQFDVERTRTSLSYFWEYIPLDNINKYNDFPQAARCYIELSKNYPELADSARIIYEMGVERFPGSDYLHNALGIIYKNRNDYKKAEMHFLAASKIDSSKTEYIIPLTEIYQQQQEWQKAKDVCEKVLAIDPANSTIRDRLETILRDHFSPEEFIASLKAKLELEPDNIGIWLQLARQYMNMVNNDEALQAVNSALKINDKNIDALTMLGVIKENLSDYKGAIDAYKKILDSEPKNVRILLDISNAYKNLNDYSTARSYVMKALDASPGNGSAYLRLGEIYISAADESSNNKQATYSDKLVFTMAYGLFKKAAESNDYDARENAQRKMDYLANNQILPQKSDWFMRQNQLTPNQDNYKWIDENWSEVKFIKTFVEQYK